MTAWYLVLAFVTLASAQEALHAREYFFVGGQYVNTPSGILFQNQMYVEKLSPPKITQRYPIIFLHGGGQDGSNFLNKPDGGKGWASWFLEKGYQVYIADETARGRSPWNPTGNSPIAVFTTEKITSRFTAVQSSTLWPQAKLHNQWPGTGLPGDAVFDAYYASVIQGIADGTEQERAMKEAGVALLDKIGPSILITHSQGGLYGWAIADARPTKIKALIQVEPKGPPFQEVIFSTEFTRPWGLTSVPLTYSPAPANSSAPLATRVVAAPTSNLTDCILQAEPARKLPNLAKVPILIDTGEASYHAMYDYCSFLFLKQAGVEAEFLELGKAGIHGNAHLQFMEKNSDVIAAKLHEWILKTTCA
ncbi:Alpha/Beta hydrolase protein [Truncatella angustata]|uniref:Alpha/Beta hydrolase protein n=1 Tax=Truncatella angustata TaxID=152316 RepID=A0A9P8UIQ5_9PEZI|nr:Alpha/Beta hydrolase protein [Truncatella angustata]KAH6652960.1 Alpha/Beta hydrolase protein [Truncatella angustata]